jgi:ABC-type glycerol-3-phosphate transport system substrate-binding protein
MWGTVSNDSFSTFTSRYFGESNLKYSVTYTEKDPATFDRELVEALASGTGPDTVILPADMIIRYRDRIYPIPYVSYPELTFKQTFIQEGELYLTSAGALALPFSVDPLVMYWNRDIFNNVGVTKPPTTWAEISSLVPKMTKKDQNKNIIASVVALGEFRNVVNAKEILSALLIQAGNPIVKLDTDGAYKNTLKDDFGLSTTPAALSLSFFTNFSNPNKSTYTWNRSLPNSLTAFANGDLAIYFGFASEFTKIKDKNPNLNFDVAILPQVASAKVYNTYGNIMGLAIMRSSRDLGGAFTALTSLTSAAAVPYWKDTLNIPSARRDILSQTESNAIKAVFNQSAIISKGWLDPNKAQTNAIFQDMVESYTTDRESLDSAIGTASDRLDSLLGN